MPLDTLNDSEFEGTLLDQNKDDSFGFANKGTSEPSSNFKGTILGQPSSLEKELGITVDKKEDPKSGTAAAVKKSKSKSNEEFESLFGGIKDYTEGDTVSGIVTKIQNGIVFVDIAYKAEGIIEPDELSNDPTKKADIKVGDKISVKILRLENKAGNPVLSKKRADYEVSWQNLEKAARNNQEVEVYVINYRNDGLSVDYNRGIKGFIPISQLPEEDEEQAKTLIGKTISVKVLKADRKKRKLILSLKKAQHSHFNKKSSEALAAIKPGQIIKGKVTSIKSYGAFVNLGEVDGLVHISELSWSRIDKVEDMLQLDQEVEVYVIGVNMDTGKISLSIKRLSADPWEIVNKNYKVGDKVKAVITRTVQFGAFASIDNSIEGLIHITELADRQIKYPEEAVKIGQEVNATIIRMEQKNHRLALSLRENPVLETAPEQTQSAETQSA